MIYLFLICYNSIKLHFDRIFIGLMLYDLIKYEYCQGGIEIVGFEDFPEVVIIPSVIDGKKVKKISAHSFESLQTLKKVIIEDRLEYIGEYAFFNCHNLKAIILPDTVSYIGRDAFSNTPIIDNAIPCGGVIYIGRHLIKAVERLSAFTVNGVITIAEEAFINQVDLKTLTFTNGLKYIAPRAFYNCGIEDINLSYSVEKIGAFAFAECKELTSAFFPNSIKQIEEGVFFNTPLYNSHSELYVGKYLIKAERNKKVKLKKDTIALAEGAFAESEVESVDLRGITEIPPCCFYKCRSLKKVKSLPLTTIGEGAFAFCSSLEELSIAKNASLATSYDYYSANNKTLPQENILYLGKRLVYARELYGEYNIKYGTLFVEEKAFKDNDRLTGVTFPSSVVRIGSSALINCPFLKKITLSDKLKAIPDNFAPDCELQEIFIPDSISVIGKEAFSKCGKLKGEIVCSAISLGERCFYGTAISKIHFKKPVLLFGKEAFAFSSSLKDISFNVCEKSKISEGCFKGCRSIVNLVLPDGLKSIPSACFAGCVSLKSIYLPDSVEIIEKRCFLDCKFLEKINLSRQVLYTSCFENCSSLKEATVNQERIPPSTFKNCFSLERISLSSSLRSIGSESFYSTTSLREIILPDTLEIIEKSAFKNSGVQEITLPPSVIINENAFEASSLLRVLSIDRQSAKVGMIGEYAFSDCISLEEVHLPSETYSLQKGVFSGCTNLASVKFNDELYSIGEEAFYGCTLLKEITLPDSLLSIGKGFFTGGKIYKKNLNDLLRQEHGALLKLGGNIIEYDHGFISVPLFGEGCYSDNNWKKGSLSSYDSVFALDTQNKELKIDYVTQRLLYPYKLSRVNKKLFIAEYLDDIMFNFITEQRLDDITRLNDNSCFSEESVQAYIKFSSEMKNFSVTALLLDILRRL